LASDCDVAISLADIEAAAEKFGKAIGAVGARILVTLAMMLIGGKVLPKKLPPPPGAPLALQSVIIGDAASGLALQTVPVLVVDWDVAAAQAAWAIQVLADGSVVIVASGSGTSHMMASIGAGTGGPPRVKGAAKPTGAKGGKPTGTPDKINPGDDAETVRGHMGERKAADALADNGYNVQHKPKPTWGDPDYLIDGKYFDAYSPGRGKSLEGIWSVLREDKLGRQAWRFVVYLDDWLLGPTASRMDVTKFLGSSSSQ
jgi:hypothetical protein